MGLIFSPGVSCFRQDHFSSRLTILTLTDHLCTESGTESSKYLQVIVEGTETLSSDSLQSHVLQRSHSHANESVESL